MKRYTAIAGINVVLIVVLASCNLFGNRGVTLEFQASEGGVTASVASRSVIGTGVEITDFLLSIREVEFKTDETDPDNPTDVFFAGPYTIDLLDDDGPLAQTIGNAEVPPGEYQAIRFKLHKTTAVDVSSPLYDRSIYIAGTIDGVPFEMWHDTSENMDVAEATGVLVTDAPITVTIDFDLLEFLDQSALASDGGSLIDLTTATNDVADGTIDISPNSTDGSVNRDLADALKDNIKLVADIIDS